MRHFNSKLLLRAFHAAIMFGVLLFVANTSHATTLTFEKITANNNIDLSGQLSVEMTEVTGGVEFKFINNVGLDSSLTDIYFDLGLAGNETIGSNTLFSGFDIIADSDTLAVTTDVFFQPDATPVVLPAGNPLNFTSDYDADAPKPKQGLDQGGEWVTFLATLGTGYSYDSALNAIFDGSLRIGLHIQSIGDACSNGDSACSDSSSYTNVSTVPVPAAAWLFGTALFGFLAASRRKNKS